MTKLSMFAKIQLIGIVLLILSGCAATESKDGTPAWQTKAMNREVKELPATPLTIDESGLTTSINGTLSEPVEPFDGGWYVGINADTETLVECYVYSDNVDPANFAVKLSNSYLDNYAAQTETTVDRELDLVSGGNIESIPYVALDWLFTSSSAGETSLGMIKVRVTSLDEYGIACVNADLGYKNTLNRIFETFVSDFKSPNEPTAPYYVEMFNLFIGDQNVGYVQEKYTLDNDGDTTITSQQSLLVPTTNTEVSASDNWSISYSRPDGTLINQYGYGVDNDELTGKFTLTKNDDDQWVAKGEFQGKPFQNQIRPSDTLMSKLGQLRVVQKLALTPQALSEEIDIWAPSLDPTSFLSATFKTDLATDSARKISAILGPMSLTAGTDNNGTVTDLLYNIGQVQIEANRVWQSGGF